MIFAWGLSALALAFGAALGVRALIDPDWAAKFVRLKPDEQGGGFAEFRATYGGVFLGLHLVALVFTLARHGVTAKFWVELARISLFLLWAALGTAALWCGARGLLSRLDVVSGSAFALAIALAVTALATGGAMWLEDYTNRTLGAAAVHPDGERLQVLLRNLAVCAIAGGLALRYFYVSHQWQVNVEAEAQSRVRALQARIRPHFLFNSMNTIAALTRSDPKRAEEAVVAAGDHPEQVGAEADARGEGPAELDMGAEHPGGVGVAAVIAVGAHARPGETEADVEPLARRHGLRGGDILRAKANPALQRGSRHVHAEAFVVGPCGGGKGARVQHLRDGAGIHRHRRDRHVRARPGHRLSA